MSTSNEQQNETKRNTRAIISLVLGVTSVILALFNFAPGLCSALGCVGALAAVLAFIAGARGIRAARELDGQGHKLAVAGVAAGGLGLLVFIVVMGSAALEGVLSTRGDLEAPLMPSLQTPQPIPSPGTVCDGKGCNGDTWSRPADGMVMVYVPAGEFEMGSDGDEVDYALQLCNKYSSDDCEREWFEEEQPAHTVVLDGFWIDQTEVTNAQFQQCVEAGPCYPPERDGLYTADSYYGNSTYDDYPVVWVISHQAVAYCAWAGARLPTEAEWEYAARGPEGRVFPWGHEFDGTRLNYCDASCGKEPLGLFDWADEAVDDGYTYTAPVGSYPDGVSWCGALDMAGNVREGVADWYAKDYYRRSPSENPTGPSSEEGFWTTRVARGGAWIWSARDARSAARFSYPATGGSYDTGFRCARDSE